MQIAITWHPNPKNGKWIILVLRNGGCIAVVVREDEAACRAWAEKNMPLYLKGKVPQYG